MLKYFFLIIFYSLSIQAGQEIGNGGKFVKCTDQQYYFIDYILTVNNPFGDIQPQLSFQQRIQQIVRNLQRLNDPLAGDLQEFMSLLYQQIPGTKYRWFPWTNMPALWDPNADPKIPARCNVKKQAALYAAPYKDAHYVTYYYDPQLIAEVQSQKFGELQISFLWVHEWLWNYYSRMNFINLAYFNRLLHSQKMNIITPAEYYKIKSELLK